MQRMGIVVRWTGTIRKHTSPWGFGGIFHSDHSTQVIIGPTWRMIPSTQGCVVLLKSLNFFPFSQPHCFSYLSSLKTIYLSHFPWDMWIISIIYIKVCVYTPNITVNLYRYFSPLKVLHPFLLKKGVASIYLYYVKNNLPLPLKAIRM